MKPNKKKIINCLIQSCRTAQSGCLKFGYNGFVDLSVSWDFKGNFKIQDTETKINYVCGSLNQAIETIKNL